MFLAGMAYVSIPARLLLWQSGLFLVTLVSSDLSLAWLTILESLSRITLCVL